MRGDPGPSNKPEGRGYVMDVSYDWNSPQAHVRVGTKARPEEQVIKERSCRAGMI